MSRLTDEQLRAGRAGILQALGLAEAQKAPTVALGTEGETLAAIIAAANQTDAGPDTSTDVDPDEPVVGVPAANRAQGSSGNQPPPKPDARQAFADFLRDAQTHQRAEMWR